MNPIFFGQNQLAYSFFSDDFNRANSDAPGSQWGNEFGDVDIVSNTMRFPSSAQSNSVFWNLPLDRLTQWVKFTASWSGSGNVFGPYFRAALGGTTGYFLTFDNNANSVSWYTYTPTTIVGSAGSLSGVNNGDTFGVTIQGLGTNTVVRVWRNPTGFPISSGNWNGDTSPDVTFTSNPSPARDTGLYIGFWGQPDSSGNNLSIDNWFAGTCPD